MPKPPIFPSTPETSALYVSLTGGRTVAFVHVTLMMVPASKKTVPFCPGWFTRVPTTTWSSDGLVGMVPLAAVKVVL
jgi:hypothetical protein